MKVGVDALEHRARPLEPHAGIDVAARQRGQVVGRRAHAVELREHEVPDLHIAAVGHPVEDLAARTADTVGPLRGRTGRPEVVVFAHPRDPRGRHPDLVGPDREGLVVILVDGDREFLGRDVQPTPRGQKLPGPVDGLPLEIVTKREVSEHLEEGVMPWGPAHVVDVARPQTLLAGGGPRKLQLALAKKVVFELIHARGREQHRRIPARHEHVARPPHTALRLEECEIRFAEVIGLHIATGSRRNAGPSRRRGRHYTRRSRRNAMPLSPAPRPQTTPPTSGRLGRPSRGRAGDSDSTPRLAAPASVTHRQTLHSRAYHSPWRSRCLCWQ